MHLHIPQTRFNTRQHTANPASHVLAHTPLQRNCSEANPSHSIIPTKNTSWGFPDGLAVKNLPANVEDMGSIPGLGRSLGEGNGNPLQYCCLGNPMDRGAWRGIVHGVSKSLTRLRG